MLDRLTRYLRWRRRDRAQRAVLSKFRTGDLVHLAGDFSVRPGVTLETICVLRLSKDIPDCDRHPEDKLWSGCIRGENIAYVWVPGFHSSQDRGFARRPNEFVLVEGPW